MQKLGTVTYEMIEHVGELIDAFHQIDAERTRTQNVRHNIVNPVESVPVHVQNTQALVNEPAEHVQSVPSHDVINLVI